MPMPDDRHMSTHSLARDKRHCRLEPQCHPMALAPIQGYSAQTSLKICFVSMPASLSASSSNSSLHVRSLLR